MKFDVENMIFLGSLFLGWTKKYGDSKKFTFDNNKTCEVSCGKNTFPFSISTSNSEIFFDFTPNQNCWKLKKRKSTFSGIPIARERKFKLLSIKKQIEKFEATKTSHRMCQRETKILMHDTFSDIFFSLREKVNIVN